MLSRTTAAEFRYLRPMNRLVVAAALIVTSATAVAQPKPKDARLDAATRTKIVNGAIAALTGKYVFPDVAKKIEEELGKHVKAKRYDKITSAIAFADMLTADLQAVSHDKHMRVFYSDTPIPDDPKPDAKPSADQVEKQRRMIKRFNAGFVKTERLDGNIGYVRLDGFLPVTEAAEPAAAAMTFVADTDALLIDLRYNGGGDPETVALLVSYLFDAADSQHINDIYWRPDDSTRQFWTAPDLAGRRYVGKPVYVLTSGDTFSGAEEFAYDVQALERATIVGETTGGGAHPGGPVKLTKSFAINVPMGRAINPVTKTNWEGTGVKPEVAAAADKALDTAYLAALVGQRQHLSRKEAPGLLDEVEQAITKLGGAKAKPSP